MTPLAPALGASEGRLNESAEAEGRWESVLRQCGGPPSPDNQIC